MSTYYIHSACFRHQNHTYRVYKWGLFILYKIPQCCLHLAIHRLFVSGISIYFWWVWTIVTYLKATPNGNQKHIFLKIGHNPHIRTVCEIYKSKHLRFSFYVPFNDPNEHNDIDTDTVYSDVTQISIEVENNFIPDDFVEIICWTK